MTKDVIFAAHSKDDVESALKVVLKTPLCTTGKGYWRESDFTAIQTIALKLMGELISQGKAEFIILRDEDVQKWWSSLSEAVDKQCESMVLKREEAKIREAALAKLTPEECKVLKIRMPRTKKV